MFFTILSIVISKFFYFYFANIKIIPTIIATIPPTNENIAFWFDLLIKSSSDFVVTIKGFFLSSGLPICIVSPTLKASPITYKF